MEAIKLFTNPMFKKEEFAAMLRNTMNVPTAVVDGGIILDREAFNATPSYMMPHWAFMNKDDIRSEWHTRSATPEEAALLTPHHSYNYAMLALFYNSDARELAQFNTLGDKEKQQAELMARAYNDKYGFVSVVIIDNTADEVVWIAE